MKVLSKLIYEDLTTPAGGNTEGRTYVLELLHSQLDVEHNCN
jgi:hypothetical protein